MNKYFLLYVLQCVGLSQAFYVLSSRRACLRKLTGASIEESNPKLASLYGQNSDIEESEYSYPFANSFNLLVLGDLHLEDDMTFHEEAREDCVAALKKLSVLSSASDKADDVIEEIKDMRASDLSTNQLKLLLEKKLSIETGSILRSHMVSLGDLGRKDIRHEPGDAGTTKSFEDARDFFDKFSVPYDLVTGNHDLEGLDEFDTDLDNLNAFMRCFDKDQSQFVRQIGEKTLLVGLSTTRFRDAPFSSHEVHVPDEQIEWFLNVIKSHSHEEGWKILVFSHAPIMGSGLRVLQNVHVQNGCAWMNHCSENRDVFIKTVKDSPQIKLWFSGHFHLSHDYEDSIAKVGSCTFVQAGVIGKAS